MHIALAEVLSENKGGNREGPSEGLERSERRVDFGILFWIFAIEPIASDP
jgi:hypothetical protein